MSTRAAAATKKVPARYAHRVKLFAEGGVDFRFVNPPIDAPPPPPGLEYRGRFTFPVDGKDILEGLIFAAPIGAPNGGPPVFSVSQYQIAVERFESSQTPANNLAFFGRVIATPVPSPFGDLVGRLAAITGGYTEGPQATFTLLGGPVSGNHSTHLPTATGSLTIQDRDEDD